VETIDERMPTRPEDVTPDPLLLEPSYAASVRRYTAQLQEEHREAWRAHFLNLALVHEQLLRRTAKRPGV
jgi:hypothetical protein